MKQIMRSTLLSLCTVMIFSGCHFNSQYINSEGDRQDAEKVTARLYELIKSKNYEEATGLFSNKFFEVSSKQKLIEFFTATNKKLGDLVSTKIETWQTRRVEGSNPSADYLLLYKNKYDKFESKENITLTRDPDGKIRITGYHVNSDGFLTLN
jgi:hypothetical protein